MQKTNAHYRIFCTCLVLVLGCAIKQPISRSSISEKIEKTSGYTLSKSKKAGWLEAPPNVVSEDGLTEDEAVAIALWNNPQFQSDLASVALFQADVMDAGVVSNPLLRYLSPGMGLSVSGYVNFAFDFLWQRPKRIAAASVEAQRNSEVMVQRGFTLIRDVQITYADMLLAKERAIIFAQNAQIRAEMTGLANSRLRNGDISRLEATTFRADSAGAADEAIRARLDTIIQKNRLNALLGFPPDTNVVYLPYRDTILPKLNKENYLDLAFAFQPQLRASQIALESVGARLGLERSRVLALVPTVNYQHLENKSGPTWLPNAFNPGIQMELPFLNRNQGRIARARGELEQASFQYYTVRQRIALEVTEAYNRYEQTYESYLLWNSSTLPILEDAVRLVRLSYQRGDISYLPLLEAMRQLVAGKLRKAEIEAELRRSISQINFSIGNKYDVN